MDALRPFPFIYAKKLEFEYVNIEIFMKLSWQKKRKNKNWIQLVEILPITSSRTCIGQCYLHRHVPRIEDQHVCMRFLQFGQCQMYCWYLYFSVKTLILNLSSIMSSSSLQYVWYLSLFGIWWTPTCLLIQTWVVNQHLSLFFWKYTKALI